MGNRQSFMVTNVFEEFDSGKYGCRRLGRVGSRDEARAFGADVKIVVVRDC